MYVKQKHGGSLQYRPKLNLVGNSCWVDVKYLRIGSSMLLVLDPLHFDTTFNQLVIEGQHLSI